jgi:histidine triad (HIT) family protein
MMVSMPDCIFCKIAAGEIPSRKTHHEDDAIVSFLDINQSIPGHTLVIPVAHHAWFYELPDELATKLFRASRHVAQELKEKMGADYVQLSIVGTDIPHVHVHLLPRFLKDKPPVL